MTRPCRSISPARIFARALAGLVTEPPKTAGMQVAVRAGHPKLVIGDAAQPVGNGRHAGGELAAVADHDAVARQPVAVLGQIPLQAPLPTSSSPSMMNFKFTGSRPSTVIQASALFRWVNIWPLSSVAPRA